MERQQIDYTAWSLRSARAYTLLGRYVATEHAHARSLRSDQAHTLLGRYAHARSLRSDRARTLLGRYVATKHAHAARSLVATEHAHAARSLVATEHAHAARSLVVTEHAHCSVATDRARTRLGHYVATERPVRPKKGPPWGSLLNPHRNAFRFVSIGVSVEILRRKQVGLFLARFHSLRSDRARAKVWSLRSDRALPNIDTTPVHAFSSNLQMLSPEDHSKLKIVVSASSRETAQKGLKHDSRPILRFLNPKPVNHSTVYAWSTRKDKCQVSADKYGSFEDNWHKSKSVNRPWSYCDSIRFSRLRVARIRNLADKSRAQAYTLFANFGSHTCQTFTRYVATGKASERPPARYIATCEASKSSSFVFSFESRSKHFSFRLNRSFRRDFTTKTCKTRLKSFAYPYLQLCVLLQISIEMSLVSVGVTIETLRPKKAAKTCFLAWIPIKRIKRQRNPRKDIFTKSLAVKSCSNLNRTTKYDCPKAPDMYPNRLWTSSSMAIGPQTSQARSICSDQACTQLGRCVATESEPSSVAT
ncbi:hypothetical protein IGI04_030086 [Brassica rapa subsp. trilocularis]|uniref:DUF4005 domain-containing protein n=1 Tax=Brassica rapa subsp. trilocularis TaxID=1813537 RepID=A0ABQ7LPN9_BRACM|nr:hypothetical protein IGI04_030086 [Brassica rapa subsp. trilocularis]